MMTTSKDIDHYIAAFPPETRVLLEKIRAIIQKTAPKAEEVISYKMPAYQQDGGILVYFAGYAKHIGFYPTGAGIEAFKKEIAAYKNSKGAVQFPLDKRLPVGLITKMVKFRVKKNAENAKVKKKKGAAD
ncbi:MAG: hypothetical protein JWO44_745 [Bacteroidetes bacterium]|nr:hypothetical protein [Bacteroidota bacterium]